jgi:hypothetical protein
MLQKAFENPSMEAVSLKRKVLEVEAGANQ